MALRAYWKKLGVSLAVPLGVGALSALLTRQGIQRFAQLQQPSLSPPGWLFPVVWTALFVLMGIAAYLVWQHGEGLPRRNAMAVYGVQLLFNFLWSVFFFAWELHLFAFVWLVVLWALIAANAALFYRIRPGAGYLLVPYLLWVSFAGYLNFAVWLLN